MLALDDTLLALRVKQSTMVNLSDPRSGISEQRLDPGTWLVALNARHSLRFQYEVECKYLLIVDFCSLLAFIDAATPADAHCASGAVGGRQLLMPVPEGSFDSRKATESWFLWQKLEGTREDLRRWLRTKEAYSLISYLLHNSDSAHLNEMCHAYGLSYSHFRKICRNTLGKAAKVKLKEWRVARAVLDIVEGRGSILEVAMQNGYASASHISNEIKRELGITPSMFAHSEKLLKLSDR
ncbi:helix-turn-helix domain-containing protein [Pseudomonas batumici]|uniref:helix-turn-helix domain-containing protein n=1 Tax=Pseudomonas batumici TaxID=226910 RepID=UPI0030CB9552